MIPSSINRLAALRDLTDQLNQLKLHGEALTRFLTRLHLNQPILTLELSAFASQLEEQAESLQIMILTYR